MDRIRAYKPEAKALTNAAVSVLDPLSALLPDMLSPCDEYEHSFIAIQLPMTADQRSRICSRFKGRLPHNRIWVDSQPIEITEKHDWEPRLLHEVSSFYQTDIDCPAAREDFMSLVQEWVADSLITPLLAAVLNGGLLASSHFKARQPGVFSYTGYVNQTRSIAITRLHGEAGDLNGVNVCFDGKAIWVFLVPTVANVKLFHEVFAKVHPGQQPKLYSSESTFLFDLPRMVAAGVQFEWIEQTPGMCIISMPGAAHQVWTQPQCIKLARNALIDIPAVKRWSERSNKLPKGEASKLSTLMAGSELDDLCNEPSPPSWWHESWQWL